MPGLDWSLLSKKINKENAEIEIPYLFKIYLGITIKNVTIIDIKILQVQIHFYVQQNAWNVFNN
ncbi:hypothetical protein NQ317_011362 [Molorchus minor]|uniref:Uncharacterized protein n=1 Tax=Molorchus minor TaxID=1323400 RepID=A0ABQ9JCI6_9CUCU|nr:hypothetical protein NQ317_011362 [Molorchus minor]